MSAIIKKSINGRTYEFFCESWSTSRAWGHKCTLFSPNGYAMAVTKCRYYNRTWESYEYQSVACSCVWDCLKREAERIARKWKSDNQKTRISAKQKTELLSASPYYNELNSLLNSLR